MCLRTIKIIKNLLDHVADPKPNQCVKVAKGVILEDALNSEISNNAEPLVVVRRCYKMQTPRRVRSHLTGMP